MTRVTGSEMAEKFSNFINSSVTNERVEFAEEVTRDHRTLQQDSFLTFLKCIEIWSEEKYYDARNEYAVKASKAMIQGMKDAGLY